MTNCCSTGALAKLSIAGTRMDFIEFTPQIVKALSDGSEKAIRGTLDHQKNSATEGLLHVKFKISFFMTALKNDVLLPLLGMAESPTDTFTLGDTHPTATIVLGPNGNAEQTYTEALCTKWVVTGTRGGDPVRLDTWWTAKTITEAAAGTTFISQTNPALIEGFAYSFLHGTAIFAGETRKFYNFSLGADYREVVEYLNNTTASSVCVSDHALSFSCGVLWDICSGNEELWTSPLSGDTTGSQLTLSFSRTVGAATYSTTFVVANFKLIARPPRIVKNDLARLSVHGVGFADSSTPMLVVTNDAT